jgi:hypothetical protein
MEYNWREKIRYYTKQCQLTAVPFDIYFSITEEMHFNGTPTVRKNVIKRLHYVIKYYICLSTGCVIPTDRNSMNLKISNKFYPQSCSFYWKNLTLFRRNVRITVFIFFFNYFTPIVCTRIRTKSGRLCTIRLKMINNSNTRICINNPLSPQWCS